MIGHHRLSSPRRNQQGYALLLVIFMATMLLVLATMAAPNIRTEGQREKEKEMIWRGRQYARGVKLYYRKMGRFPTSIDDLTKPKIGSLRFMRRAYKDPMNTEDGAWRLIYVGPWEDSSAESINKDKRERRRRAFQTAGLVPRMPRALPERQFPPTRGQE